MKSNWGTFIIIMVPLLLVVLGVPLIDSGAKGSGLSNCGDLTHPNIWESKGKVMICALAYYPKIDNLVGFAVSPRIAYGKVTGEVVHLFYSNGETYAEVITDATGMVMQREAGTQWKVKPQQGSVYVPVFLWGYRWPDGFHIYFEETINDNFARYGTFLNGEIVFPISESTPAP